MKLSPMLKKFKDKGKMPLIIVVICSVAGILILTVICLIAAFIIDAAKPKMEAVAFDSYSSEENYSYIEPYIMSDPFGSMGNKNLYFVLTEDNYAFVVCMNRNELGKCQDVIDWTYDVTGLLEHPGSFYIEGYPAEIDSEIEDLIVENFNYFWGEDVVNSDNVYEYFGEYYLDTTVGGSAFDNIGVILIPAIIIVMIVILIFASKRGRCNIFNNITKKLNVAEDSLARTDAEINSNEAKYFAGMKVYFTSEHFVYVKEGLLAIPYNEIYSVQNQRLDKKTGSLNIVLKDGQKILPIVVPDKNPASEELEMIVSELQTRIDTSADENINRSADVNLEIPNENKILGSLAAIGGAVLGGIIFMVLWYIGYISSISGMVGMIASVFLYQKAAKNIGTYGYIYCMIISIAGLFGAAILSYVIWLSSELGEPIISVFINIFRYLGEYGLWKGFWMDFLFGAAFSLIWFLIRVFKNR